jgi:hypothetical protein
LIDFSWYQESLYAMLWAVNIIKEMKFPSEESSISNYLQFLPPDKKVKVFLKELRLKGTEDIIQELDFYYNLHWIVKRENKGLNKSVVFERRKSLEWIVDSSITDWDNIYLST